MGYTHYWRRPRNLARRKFDAAVTDCRAVLEWLQRDQGLDIRFDSDEPGPPEFGREVLQFNGVGKEGHEPFSVERTIEPSVYQVPERGLYFEFCKTARKPYDAAVCSCLIILRHHFGERFPVSSDGEAEEEGWPVARRACQTVLGYGDNFALPERDDFGRLVRNGIPFCRSEYADEKNLYFLGNGWTIWRKRRGVDFSITDEKGVVTKRPLAVFAGRYFSDFTRDKLVCEAATLADAQFAATVEFLRRKFAGAPDLDSFLTAIENTRDLSLLSIFADRLGDADHPLEVKLRRLLPKKWAGASPSRFA